MGLVLTNSLTRTKESLAPLAPPRIGLYVCGVTVYDDCHIGHARAAVVFDTLVRYLRHRKYDVRFVRNFTDIDDKIIQRAQRENLPWSGVSRKYIEEFYRDMAPLNLLKPDHEPLATEHIPEMIDLVRKLMERGTAYESGGDVYFSIERFAGYGKLSGKKIDELQAGARVEPSEQKRNPLDFALWKASKPGEPSWPSPWGPGRPGWHLECSAMSMKYLGDSFDLHGGGLDLIFPHHENEIAQSEAATGKPFARAFLHNGFVNIRKEKMSKSEGNVVTLKELYKSFTPEAIRLFLLSAHYRSPLEYSEENIRQAEQRAFRVYRILRDVPAGSADVPPDLEADLEPFRETMDDDLNTPAALALLAGKLDLLSDRSRKPSPSSSAAAPSFLRHTVLGMGNVLGLFQAPPEDYLARLTHLHLHRQGLSRERIEGMILRRSEARGAKRWEEADQIRSDLFKLGIALEDGREGTRWHVEP